MQGEATTCWSSRWFKNRTGPILNSIHNQSTVDDIIRSNSDSPESFPIAQSGNMDPEEDVHSVHILPPDAYDTLRAKQRATIKWLLSKAYNNQTPEELLEPFYKDHEGEEHLKPYVVKGLSDAELYCLALVNLYADPNYSQLSPWGIVQALARKGSYVHAPPEMTLTETVLIQNRPLRINAHMAVMEAMMVLHVRELISPQGMVTTVQRYGPQVHPLRLWLGSGEMPSDAEEAFLLWINRAVLAIKDHLQSTNQREHGLSREEVETWNQLPLVQDLSDLVDGVSLCALLAFYCPEELGLSEIGVPVSGQPLTLSESLWNLQLLLRVAKDSLPFNICHFALEDLLYYNDSLKQNLFSFLADLFYLLELKPAAVVKPIRLSGHAGGKIERGLIRSQSATSTPKKVQQHTNTVQIHERRKKSGSNIFLGEGSSGRRSPSGHSVVSVPLRRAGTPDKSHDKDTRSYGNSSEDSEEFVVHRGRNVPTLSQLIRSVSPSSQEERSSPGSRISRPNAQLLFSSEDENGIPAAGRPSNLGANKTSYAGRRSRRNSFSEADSQLTVENFGGSQDKLNRFLIERNPDKQPAIVTDNTPPHVIYPKRQPSVEPPDSTNSRRSVERDRGRDSWSEDGRMSDPQPAFYGRKKPNYSVETKEQRHLVNERGDGGFYVQGQSHSPQFQPHMADPYGRQENVRLYVVNDGHTQSFAELGMRSTSMSNLSRLSDVPNNPVNIVYLPNNGSGSLDNRRNGYGGIDLSHQSRRPINSASHHHHQPDWHSTTSSYGETEDCETEDLAAQLAAIRLKLEEKRRRIEMEKGRLETVASKTQSKLGKAAYLKAINKDLESKWLNKTDETCRTPEIENMDTETYQRSLAKIDSNLSELETDIGRLSLQQEQIQEAKKTFFLHGDSSSGESENSKRRTWASLGSNPPAVVSAGRNNWGPPRPYPTQKEGRQGKLGQNGGSEEQRTEVNGGGGSSFRLHIKADSQGNRLFNRQSGSEGSEERENERPTPPPRQRSQGLVHHVPLPTPPPEDMEPQAVSFVQEENGPSSTELSKKSLQITSGSKTYRITPPSTSPPRPTAHNLFTNHSSEPSSDENAFYIPMTEGRQRPKPPIRMKRGDVRNQRGLDISSAFGSSTAEPIGGDDERDFEAQQRFELDEKRMRGELVVDELPRFDSSELDLMEKKKEKFLLQSLKRQQQVEEQRRKKELALQRQKELETARAEEKERKKEDEKARKQAILESYRMKKQDDLEKDGKGWEVQESSTKKFLRPKSGPSGPRQRPKTIHLSEVDSAGALNIYGQRVGSSGGLRRSDSQSSSAGFGRATGKRGSSSALYSGAHSGVDSGRSRRDPWGSTSSLIQGGTEGLNYESVGPSSSSEYTSERSTPTKATRGHNRDLHRSPDQKPKRPTTLISPSAPAKPWPGSLPSGLVSRRSRFDDGASDISSVISSNMDYSGLRLYKQPTAKSNRSIILNAVEYCVFPGAVNRDSKNRVLEEVNRTEAKHFLIMFRDAGCQFRAIYAYCPERDEIIKLFGTGPRAVNDAMFEKFFKYNSGGKCFSQVHTKHLTVTIDAFTIHNSLWTGKKGPIQKIQDKTLVV